MAIFNSNPDPDYPVLNGAGFAQHTYNQQQMGQQQFYYNGQNVTPMTYQQPVPTMQVMPMDQSRRYDAPVSAWGNPQPQPQPAPQSAFGFNQLAEQSRRNMPTLPAPQVQPTQQVSPWAVQTQPTQPTIPVQPQFVAPQPAGTYDPRYSAIYQLHPSIDRKAGVWGVQEVHTPMMSSAINWNAQPPQVPAAYPQMTYPVTYQYPTQVQQSTVENWEQIAKQTWG
jgi:hypothetical protein